MSTTPPQPQYWEYIDSTWPSNTDTSQVSQADYNTYFANRLKPMIDASKGRYLKTIDYGTLITTYNGSPREFVVTKRDSTSTNASSDKRIMTITGDMLKMTDTNDGSNPAMTNINGYSIAFPSVTFTYKRANISEQEWLTALTAIRSPVPTPSPVPAPTPTPAPAPAPASNVTVNPITKMINVFRSLFRRKESFNVSNTNHQWYFNSTTIGVILFVLSLIVVIVIYKKQLLKITLQIKKQFHF